MTKTIRLAVAAILALAISTPAFAEDGGGYAGAFMQLSVHPRAAGMGNAFTAVSDDVSGIFFNPGAVAQVQRISVGGAYRDLSQGRSLQQVAVIFPVRGEAAIGFSGQMASMSGIMGRDERGVATGELDNLDAVIAITFSRRFSKFLTLGGDVRYYHKKLESTSSYSAGFDLGGMIHLDREMLAFDGPIDLLRFGAVVRNIAAKYPWNTGDYWATKGELGTDVTDEVPISVRAGASVLFLKSRALLSVEGEKDEKRNVKMHAGGEFYIVPQFALRGGFSGGEPTFGVGFKVPVNNLDARLDIAVEQAPNIGGWETIAGFSLGF
ncbi:MAG: PorV/PorQ family protein [Candidatus Zixiibacteriota bacterium]